MSPSFRDVEEALAPWAGDPVADAARVLEALPPVASPPPAPRPLWPQVLTATLVGMLIGYGIAVATGTLASDPEDPAEPRVELQELPPLPEEDPARALEPEFYAILGRTTGRVFLDPDGQESLLAPGEDVPFDRVIETGPAATARVWLPGEIELRLGPATRCRMERDRTVILLQGTVWGNLPPNSDGMVVQSAYGDLLVPGTAAFQVETEDAMLSAHCLEGAVTFVALTGEEFPLASRFSLKGEDGSFDEPRVGENPWYLVNWQLALLESERNIDSLVAALMPLVEDLDDPNLAGAAERELRMIGGVAGIAVGEYLAMLRANRDPRSELARDLLELLCDIASSRSMAYCFAELRAGGPEERPMLARAAARITGSDLGLDDAYWRRATLVQVDEAIRRWRRLTIR